MDIDISQKRNDETSEIIRQIKNILSVKVEKDGLVFDSQSIHLEDIKRDTPYKGMRGFISWNFGFSKNQYAD